MRHRHDPHKLALAVFKVIWTTRRRDYLRRGLRKTQFVAYVETKINKTPGLARQILSVSEVAHFYHNS